MFILVYFIFLLFLFYKSKSVAIFFIALQVVSLSGIFFIDKDYPIDTFLKAFNLIFTVVILTLIISPWRRIKKIKEISIHNKAKLKKLTKFLVYVSIIPFITLSATTIIVFMVVNDINTFKYAEGVSTYFYHNFLPFNVKIFILSNYLFYFSYFLIPLHFYYLLKKNYRLAIICFILSLNIVLYGLAYFSRAVFIQYGFLYFSFLIMLYGTLNSKIKIYIKRILIISMTLASFYFIYITNQRFTENIRYEKEITNNSFIQNPILYSYIDYLSQWYSNGMYVLDSYNSKTFNGQISLQPILSLMGQYGVINYNTDDYMALRKKLWPKHWYMFNGFVAYSVFDYGYFITFFLVLVYYYYVEKLKPKNSSIPLVNLFVLVLLIQLPLLAIFYSNVAAIVIPFLMLIPIIIYLKTTIKLKTKSILN